MFERPVDTKRLTIVGRTGSGKTVFGAWVLSEANFDEMPWIVLDFKQDELLGAIPVNVMNVGDPVPREPGLFRVRPLPGEKTEINGLLLRIWEARHTGIFIDECSMISDTKKTNNGLDAVLTQGRALHIPIIALSQRPVGIDRHFFSEASMFCGYPLNDQRDRATVKKFVPDGPVWNQDITLPDYHSRWFDVGKNWSAVLGPVPPPEQILRRFRQRLGVVKPRASA